MYLVNALAGFADGQRQLIDKYTAFADGPNILYDYKKQKPSRIGRAKRNAREKALPIPILMHLRGHVLVS
jgi:hypothetical protein